MPTEESYRKRALAAENKIKELRHQLAVLRAVTGSRLDDTMLSVLAATYPQLREYLPRRTVDE